MTNEELTMIKKYVDGIKEFVATLPEERLDAVQPTRNQFTRLLGSVSAARRIPGIPVRMTEDKDYLCTGEEVVVVKDFLGKMFRIDSKESLLSYQEVQFRSSVHYEQFMTFWKGAPLFDTKKLAPNVQEIFETSMKQAETFYPMVEERGIYAWDINEYIGLCRATRAAGIITDQDFDEIVDHFVRKAQAFYHSFREYAESLLYGALYFMVEGKSPDGLDKFLDIQKKIVQNLFVEGAPWQHYAWYRPKEREWASIYPGNKGCIVSKAALDDGIGYMYKDEVSPEYPDSGWRFFRGDEDDEYVNNPENFQILTLNTVCNMRPDVLAYLEAPVDAAYGWNGNAWVEEPLEKED